MDLSLMSTEELEAAVARLTEMNNELEARKRRDYLDDLDKVLDALHTMQTKYTDKRLTSLNGMTWYHLYCAVNQEYQCK